MEIKIQQHYFLLRFYLLIASQECFSVKRKIKLVKKKSNKKGFPVKLGKEVLLKGVP